MKTDKKTKKQNNKNNKKKKEKLYNIFSILSIIFFTTILTISSIKLITYKNEEKNVDNQLKIIKEKTKIKEIKDNDNIEVIEQLEEIPKSNPYWDYIKMNLIDANFNDLKTINSEIKGWLQVNGTNINYPFVQGKDNKFYLDHSINKSHNSSGWVFLDYRSNLSDFNNKNTILYAHGRIDKTMFGSLKNILTSGWLDNKDNYIIKLSTEYENTLWQVFSVYKIPTTSDYIQVDFESDDEFNTFANMLLERSAHSFNTTISPSDRIITLSTCYNKTDKVVLHAKLIKREAK